MQFLRFITFLSLISCTLLAQELSTKYISVYGICRECDISPNKRKYDISVDRTNIKYYMDVDLFAPGSAIWISNGSVGFFATHLLPYICTPFVLVIQGSDESFPTSWQGAFDIEAFIANPYILHIFSQNCDYMGPQKHKVSHLPIGINLHTLAENKSAFDEKQASVHNQEKNLERILLSLSPTTKRKKKALIEFHLHDTIATGFKNVERYLDPGETRTTIANRLKDLPIIDLMEKRISRRRYWAEKGKYAFSISPPGNGLDTHRTWEDLILGCIVIVKSSPMDPLYEGLPVVIINDWSEITEENFTKWLQEYGDVFHNPSYRQRLTLAYWMEKIQSYRELALNWDPTTTLK